MTLEHMVRASCFPDHFAKTIWKGPNPLLTLRRKRLSMLAFLLVAIATLLTTGSLAEMHQETLAICVTVVFLAAEAYLISIYTTSTKVISSFCVQVDQLQSVLCLSSKLFCQKSKTELEEISRERIEQLRNRFKENLTSGTPMTRIVRLSEEHARVYVILTEHKLISNEDVWA